MLEVKYNPRKALVAVTVFLLIFVSKDTLVFGTNSNGIATAVGFLVPAALMVLWGAIWLMQQRHLSRQKGTNYLLAMIFLALFTAIVNLDFTVKYPYEVVLLLLAFFVTACVDLELFKAYFIKIMVFFAVCSLIVAALYFVAYPLFNLFPTVINTTGWHFHNLGVALMVHRMHGFTFRNWSIFREPGVYAIFLDLALIWEFGNPKRVRLFRVLVLLVAMLTTMSTTGYVVAFLSLVGFLLSKSPTASVARTKKRLVFVLLFALLLSVFVVNYQYVFGHVFGKLFSENDSKDSRFGSFAVNAALLVKSPLSMLLGCGFTYAEDRFPAVADGMGLLNAQNTNTIFKILAVHGIPYTCGICYGLFAFWKKRGVRGVANVIYALSFILTILNEEIIFDVLIYLLIFYSFGRVKPKEVPQREDL